MEGQGYSRSRTVLQDIWSKVITDSGLIYKNFSRSDETENWYGTFGPYIDFFCGFGLRLKEVRLGHDKMPVTKRDDTMMEIPVRKYGLNGAHHVLLEGCTFPPEKRSSMAQSMGPMTSMLCMLRSEGIYRAKWSAAVKRAFNHISVIDDIIEVTKTQKSSAEVSTLLGLLAEISLITTTRQATRIFLPLSMVYRVYMSTPVENRTKYLEYYNTTGSGAFYTYKKAIESTWRLSCSMTEEAAGQVVFHAIFGTYKEDLGVLSEITNVKTWKTREEIGKGFVKRQGEEEGVKLKMPILNYYAKMSCANQSGLLSVVYSQVSSIPSFRGKSNQVFGDDFFEHIERKQASGSTGKSIPQLVTSLSLTLDDLRKKLKESRGQLLLLALQKWS